MDFYDWIGIGFAYLLGIVLYIGVWVAVLFFWEDRTKA